MSILRQSCPGHLDDVARAEWSWVCDRLEEQGRDEVDQLRAMEIYCASYSAWRRAQEIVARLGPVLVSTDKNGSPTVRSNPALSDMERCRVACSEMLEHLGLGVDDSPKTAVWTADRLLRFWQTQGIDGTRERAEEISRLLRGG